jgi:hypothetical protein
MFTLHELRLMERCIRLCLEERLLTSDQGRDAKELLTELKIVTGRYKERIVRRMEESDAREPGRGDE